MDAVLLYAFTLGIVAAVNPCGFPLLPAYLASFTLGDAGGQARGFQVRAVGRALVAGVCVTGAFVATFGVAGFAVAAGARMIIDWVPWLMVVVGGGLIMVGLGQLTGVWHGMRLPAIRFRPGRGPAAMTGFGVAYAAGSLTCALPLFLSGVGAVFTSSGWAAGAGAFVAYAVGMGLFVTAAGVLTATAGTAAVRRFRRVGRWVPFGGGILVMLVGVYVIVYWVGQLAAPTATLPVTRWVDATQGFISAGLADSPMASVLVLGGILALAVLLAGVLVGRRGNSMHSRERGIAPDE